MSAATLTTADVAARLRCAPKTVTRYARQHGVGIRLGGRAGWRFSEADYDRLVQALSPAAPVERRRRRRAS